MPPLAGEHETVPCIEPNGALVIGRDQEVHILVFAVPGQVPGQQAMAKARSLRGRPDIQRPDPPAPARFDERRGETDDLPVQHRDEVATPVRRSHVRLDPLPGPLDPGGDPLAVLALQEPSQSLAGDAEFGVRVRRQPGLGLDRPDGGRVGGRRHPDTGPLARLAWLHSAESKAARLTRPEGHGRTATLASGRAVAQFG